jgi:hypothetical protein
MHDAPSNSELIEGVKHFLDTVAMPQLSGHAAFHARVASNALAIVLRDLAHRPNADATARARLIHLLGAPSTASLEDLNKALCHGLKSGRLGLETPGLLTHLKMTAIDQVSVDQPNYSGLETARQKQK